MKILGIIPSRYGSSRFPGKPLALLCGKPRARFGLPLNGDCSVWDLHESYEIDPADFVSLGRATPFAGRRVFGRCMMTVHDGDPVYCERV